MERRGAKRIRFTSTAKLTTDDKVVFAPIETDNISLKGLYIKTEQVIPKGTKCTIEVDLSGLTSTMRFSVNGSVVRHDGQGIGIAFSELEPDSYAHIHNLLVLHERSKDNPA